MTAEDVRNRLEQMAAAGLVSRQENDGRAVCWSADVAPELGGATAERGDARRESDAWEPL